MRYPRTLGLAIALFMGCFSPAIAADQSSLSPLSAWSGKYVFDKIEGRDAFGVEPFLEKLKKALGDERYETFVKDYQKGVTFPVAQENGVVLFNFCKPHQCADNLVYIFANTKNASVDVCWMQRAEVNGYWLTDAGTVKNLGVAGCLDDVPFGLYHVQAKEK